MKMSPTANIDTTILTPVLGSRPCARIHLVIQTCWGRAAAQSPIVPHLGMTIHGDSPWRSRLAGTACCPTRSALQPSEGRAAGPPRRSEFCTSVGADAPVGAGDGLGIAGAVQAQGDQPPQVDRCGAEMQPEIDPGDAAVAEFVVAAGRPCDGGFRHRPMLATFVLPQHIRATTRAARCSRSFGQIFKLLPVVLVVQRTRNTQLARAALNVATPVRLMVRVSSSIPTSAFPLPTPPGLLNAQSAMIPVPVGS
jgi:hypothetical protein